MEMDGAMTGSALYTPQKVYRRLADLVGPTEGVEVLHVDRYSVADAEGGLETQVARHAASYPDDVEVQAYLALPDGAFRQGTHGVRRIAPADIHHTLTDTRPAGSFVVIGRTLFVRIEMSSVERVIRREDTEDANAFTVLMLSLINCLSGLREARWSGQITRFARDSVNATTLTRRLKERGVVMRLGGHSYDLSNPANLLLIGVQTAVGANDDPERRRSLLGSRLVKMAAGGAVSAEHQLPYGYRIARRDSGSPLHDGERGLVPVADPTVAEVLQRAHRMHADGEGYEAMCRMLAECEQAGTVVRRSGQRYGTTRTFADAIRAGKIAPYDAAKSVVQGSRGGGAHRNGRVPNPVRPEDAAIEAYLDGADPVDVFTISQRLVISRVELLRTGRYLRAVSCDIRQRGLVLCGFTPHYVDDHDEYGYFAIDAPWPQPTDPATGEPMLRWGIPDKVLRRSGARLLRTIRATSAATGARAHRGRDVRRAVQNFPSWTDNGFDHRVTARHQQHNDTANCTLQRRAATQGGWGTNPTRFIIATWRLPSLCTDLAERISAAIETALIPADVATVGQTISATAEQRAEDARASLLAHAEQADLLAAEAERAAAGARRMAALVAGQDETSALAYNTDAAHHSEQARSARAEADRYRAEAADIQVEDEPDEANLTVAAYLVAGLKRAARNRGYAATPFGLTADTYLSDWRFDVGEDHQLVVYTVTLRLPLLAGGYTTVALSGQVRNVRATRGRREGSTNTTGYIASARRVLLLGENLDQVAEEKSRRATTSAPQRSRARVLTAYVMPWMTKRGITNPGMKNALIDHPLHIVRQIMFADLTGEHVEALDNLAADLQPWRRHIIDTYRSPMRWGNAAILDEVTLPRTIVTALAADPASGVNAHVLADALGVGVKTVQQTVVPRKIQSGPVRPVYAAYAQSKAGTLLRVIVCPHDDCTGTCDGVVPLPEVAASGYGVICSTCRRAPNTRDPKWATITFPPGYFTPWTRNPHDGQRSLRTTDQTVPAQPSPHLDVERTHIPADGGE